MLCFKNTYQYDSFGRIIVHQQGNEEDEMCLFYKTYEYDSKGQLVEDSDRTNTYEYGYDKYGNITSICKNGIQYFTATYEKGLLKSYNNSIITYDESGLYPIRRTFGTLILETYQWQLGRLISYTNNNDGIRKIYGGKFGSYKYTDKTINIKLINLCLLKYLILAILHIIYICSITK